MAYGVKETLLTWLKAVLVSLAIVGMGILVYHGFGAIEASLGEGAGSMMLGFAILVYIVRYALFY